MAQQQSDYRFTFASAAGEFDVTGFGVTEALSDSFQLQITLARMNDAPVSFTKALDNPGTLTFWKGDKVIRYLNGIISFFQQTEAGKRRTHYTATIVPTFSRTDLYSNIRTFQQKTVPDIIKQVLKADGIDFIRFDLEAEHVTREYCVQYRETDKAFIERIAAEEGMFYTFEHAKDTHTLVFCDSVFLLKSLGKVLHNPNISASRTEPSLWGFSYQEQIATAQHKMRDYTFYNPDYSLEHQATSNNAENQHNSYVKYDYPGRYKKDAAGKPFNQYRLEYERRSTQLGFVTSDDLTLTAGKYITLSQAPSAKPQTTWLITSLTHEATQSQSLEEDGAGGGGNHYHSELELIPHGKAWRAEPQPKPRVNGEQIARVTGPKGEEIYCDEHGRVKIQFPWDLEGQYDDLSSCWVRVSQGWAGAAWGQMAIPRVNQEVIVSFLEGDPDQPIITGRTYHASNKPPYELPKHKTRMSIKSKTHKGKGFNELRFEDEAGQEQVFLHAQKDQDIRVLNDSREWIGNDRHLITKNNQFEHVEGNKHSYTAKDRYQHIEGDQHLIVHGDQNETIQSDTSRIIGENLQQKIGNKHAIEAGTDMHFKAGTNLVIEAGNSITLKAGSGFITVNTAGVFINGAKIDINSGGSPLMGAGSNPAQAIQARRAVEADDATSGWKALPPEAAVVEEPVIEADLDVVRTKEGFPFEPYELEPPTLKLTYQLSKYPGSTKHVRKQEPYKLYKDGAMVQQGLSDDKGIISYEYEAPLNASTMEVEVEHQRFKIDIQEEFAPAETKLGVEQRLTALGYNCFEDAKSENNAHITNDGKMDVRWFQGDGDTEADGSINENIIKKLKGLIS